MFPFGNLPSNLIAFAAYLRTEHDFRIGAGELHDAARALDVVDVRDESAIRNALRPILSTTRREAGVFDRAFAAFFFPARVRARHALRVTPERGSESAETIRRALSAGGSGRPSGPPSDRLKPVAYEQEENARVARGPAIEEQESGSTLPASRASVSYSPAEVEHGGDEPELRRPDPAWRDAARTLVRRQQLGLSRRWRSAARGRRFDLRRTLRASLQTGGEALSARWLRRPRRTPRFVVLVDGSRSMGAYARIGLDVAVALATATMRVEAFTFSTALRRVTIDVRRAAAGETRRLGRLHHAWAGGTSIGACLEDFVRRFGERLLGRDTIVVVVSDGLDVGAPDVVRRAMRRLHGRSAAVVWLNPLLDTAGYEPTAAGMRAARRYVTTFASVTDADGLARLSRVLRVRV
jgi:hypothetical protein